MSGAEVARDERAWLLAIGVGTSLLFAVAHAAHDGAEGAGWRHAALPSAAMLLQVGALEVGSRWTGGLAAGVRAAGAALISALFGVLFVELHEPGWFGEPHVIARGAVLGLCFLGFWALAFRVPPRLWDARLRTLAAEDLRREAELSRLRASRRPHFLLNTVGALVGPSSGPWPWGSLEEVRDLGSADAALLDRRVDELAERLAELDREAAARREAAAEVERWR